MNAKNGTVSDAVAVATRPFFTPSNETLNAEVNIYIYISVWLVTNKSRVVLSADQFLLPTI